MVASCFLIPRTQTPLVVWQILRSWWFNHERRKVQFRLGRDTEHQSHEARSTNGFNGPRPRLKRLIQFSNWRHDQSLIRSPKSQPGHHEPGVLYGATSRTFQANWYIRITYRHVARKKKDLQPRAASPFLPYST